jgi:hypothetical protein
MLNWNGKQVFGTLMQRVNDAGHWVRYEDNVELCSDEMAVQEIIDGFTLDDARAPIIAAIKAEAETRILAFLPMWRQSNLNARANELNASTHRLSVKRLTGGLSTDEAAQELAIEAELQVLQGLWDRAKAIRTASNAHEANLGACPTFSAINAYDITVGWPE